MKKIELTQGRCAVVDNEDYDRLNKFKWHYSQGYASNSRSVKKSLGKQGPESMHRLVLNAKEGEEVDHINRNPLDNRRKNLRIVTRSQNNRNRGGKGYSFHKKRKKWEAQICINRKIKHLGYFSTEIDARKAYLIEYNKCFEKFRVLKVPKSLSMTQSLKSPKSSSLQAIKPKYAVEIIKLLEKGPMRFGELETFLSTVSPRTLSLRLVDLAEHKIVTRKSFDEVPPRVEYSLTKYGLAVVDIIRKIEAVK